MRDALTLTSEPGAPSHETESVNRIPVATFSGTTNTRTFITNGHFLPDLFSPLAELRVEQIALEAGNAVSGGITTIDGHTVEKIVSKESPVAFAQLTTYVDTTTRLPVRFESTRTENGQTTTEVSHVKVAFLDATPENVALVSVAAQHPDSLIGPAESNPDASLGMPDFPAPTGTAIPPGFVSPILTAAEVADGMTQATLMLRGTAPTCVGSAPGPFRCNLTKPADAVLRPTGSLKGARYLLVNPEARVSGGCLARDEVGGIWECWLGRAAVERGLAQSVALGLPTSGAGG